MDYKKILIYILLGFIQGITEPLPISSSGHMVVLEYFLHISFSDLNFKIFVNLASLLAIIIYYRKFISNLVCGCFLYLFKKDKNRKNDFLYFLYIVIACVPSGIFGIFLKDYIDSQLSNILTVTISFFITSIVLFIIHNLSLNKNKKELNYKKSLAIGSFQIVGLIPGISRSGITSLGGLLNKLSLDEALRFSFMMYIPTSLGALILSIPSSNIYKSFNISYFLSFLTSFIGTYIGLVLFFHLVKKENFKYFAIYLLILSIILLIFI